MNEFDPSKKEEQLFGKPLSEMDTLLNDPFAMPSTPALQNEKQTQVQPQKVIETLSPEQQKKAISIAEQINPKNQQGIIQYGIAAQAELSRFSHAILQHVQTKDTGPVGAVIGELMTKIREVDPEDFTQSKGGFFSRLFGSISNSLQQMMSKYQKIGVDIDKIADQLEKFRQTLMRDVAMLETLFQKNREYFEVLNIYIAAGEYKLEELQTKTIPSLEQTAKESGNQMDVQEVNDMVQFANRLDKRLHDLKLSRQITIQTAPQIRMIQNMNQVLIEKIQSSILTAIPLWKNQVVIALTLFRQQKALEAQKQVTKTTNELLLKNSEMLKVNTIETARESERGLVEIDTLKQTQANLIETLEETLKIQQEGKSKRMEAERELTLLEQELKTKLLSMNKTEM